MIANDAINKINEYTADENGDGLLGKVQEPEKRPWYMWLILGIVIILGLVLLWLIVSLIYVLYLTFVKGEKKSIEETFTEVVLGDSETSEFQGLFKKAKEEFEQYEPIPFVNEYGETDKFDMMLDRDAEIIGEGSQLAKWYLFRKRFLQIAPQDFENAVREEELTGIRNPKYQKYQKELDWFFTVLDFYKSPDTKNLPEEEENEMIETMQNLLKFLRKNASNAQKLWIDAIFDVEDDPRMIIPYVKKWLVSHRDKEPTEAEKEELEQKIAEVKDEEAREEIENMIQRESTFKTEKYQKLLKKLRFLNMEVPTLSQKQIDYIHDAITWISKNDRDDFEGLHKKQLELKEKYFFRPFAARPALIDLKEFIEARRIITGLHLAVSSGETDDTYNNFFKEWEKK